MLRRPKIELSLLSGNQGNTRAEQAGQAGARRPPVRARPRQTPGRLEARGPEYVSQVARPPEARQRLSTRRGPYREAREGTRIWRTPYGRVRARSHQPSSVLERPRSAPRSDLITPSPGAYGGSKWRCRRATPGRRRQPGPSGLTFVTAWDEEHLLFELSHYNKHAAHSK